MSLPADEFIRRFLLHVLPRGFTKIRYFGFLAHINKKQAVALIRNLLGVTMNVEKTKETIPDMMLRLTGKDITCCPRCKMGTMTIITKLSRHYYDSS